MSNILHQLRHTAADLSSSYTDDHAFGGTVHSIVGCRRLRALLNSSFCHGCGMLVLVDVLHWDHGAFRDQKSWQHFFTSRVSRNGKNCGASLPPKLTSHRFPVWLALYPLFVSRITFGSTSARTLLTLHRHCSGCLPSAHFGVRIWSARCKLLTVRKM
jgi:hypothetical protein